MLAAGAISLEILEGGNCLLLTQLKDPAQLKDLSVEELEDLARQIRLFLIQSISRTGGHLSSNLGIVELTLALHTVFNSPKDKIIFDVGHQSYTHKILTGRMNQFKTLRQFHGLSGYQKRAESEHDSWEAGHSSTSLSAGLGMAIARDLQGGDFEVVSVIGDGALGSGMALEALNDLGAQHRKMIIIFNDNKMSISPNIGGIERSITKVRTSKVYRETKKDLYDTLIASNTGKEILNFLRDYRDRIKEKVIDAPLFTSFDLDYIGPVDGSNIPELIDAFQTAKEHDGPIVVHVLTNKGKGYSFAEQDETGVWHGVGPFDIRTGKFLGEKKPDQVSWSEVAARTLYRLAAQDQKLCVITPAMATGSALLPFAHKYPDRFFDPGIAEEHAVTMAGAMAAGGLHPFVSIYSSFLQRAYDQVLHDVARMDLPVVFGIDRAGLVGSDGETHQGIYDISFLNTIPNVVLCQPADATEAQNLIYTGFQYRHPFFIRYPRGKTHFQPNANLEPIEIGTWTSTETGTGTPEQIVIAYGEDVKKIEQRAARENLNLKVVNARFLIPLDTAMLDMIFDSGLPVTIYETDSPFGGLSTSIARYLETRHQDFDLLTLKDGFIPQGSISELRKDQQISLDDLFERLDAHASRSETS